MKPYKPEISSSIDAVAQTWKAHWQNSHLRPDASFRGRLLRFWIRRVGGFSSSRWILKKFLQLSGSVHGRTILDAGSGTGLNSLPLSARGADLTLLDISPEALSIAKAYFEEQGLKASFIQGSIFELPFPDESFDIVWNTGVIEHFEPEVRKKAVQEMLRVMKSSGQLLTFNPNANASIYRWAKRIGERRGNWDVGVEIPIETLVHDIDPSRYEISEFEAGWFMQFQFVKYALPRRLRLIWAGIHELIQSLLPFLNHYPGYVRVSVIRKRQNQLTKGE